MKIAFIPEPCVQIRPTKQAGSMPIWAYEITRRVAQRHEVIVYETQLDGQPAEEKRDGVLFRRLRAARDRAPLKQLRHVDTLRRVWNVGEKLYFSKPDQPYLSSSIYFRSFIHQVARDLQDRHCDFVHIQNYPQFVPVVRRQNPRLRIALHVQCEWLSHWNRNMIRSRLKDADLAIGPSEYITSQIRRAFPEFASRCRTVVNGVDVNRFKAREVVRTGEEASLLFVGRVSPEKGAHVLLQAFQEIVRVRPQTRLRIIGKVASQSEGLLMKSDDSMIEALRPYYHTNYGEQLKKLITPQMEKNVEFVGMVPNSRLEEYYREADLVTIPSVWQDPMPFTVLEGLASGLPIVATRSGGIPEMIEDGISGTLIDRGNVEQLSSAVLGLLRNPERRRTMGAAARARAANFFSWDHAAESLVETFQSYAANSTPNQKAS